MTTPVVLAGLLTAANAHAGVLVQPTVPACYDASALGARLATVARKAKTKRLALDIRVRGRWLSRRRLRVQLTAEHRGGEPRLHRVYTVSQADCAEITPLLLAVLERFVATFPQDTLPPASKPAVSQPVATRPAPKPTSRPTSAPTRQDIPLPQPAHGLRRRASPAPLPASRGRRLGLSLLLALNSNWLPANGDVELGGRLTLRLGAHELGLGLHAALALPRSLGEGRQQQLIVSAAPGWRYCARRWRPGVALRAGGIALWGSGFEHNRSRWLPWFELVGSIDYRLAWGALGLQAAAALVNHRGATNDGAHRQDVPLLRLGLTFSVPLWGHFL